MAAEEVATCEREVSDIKGTQATQAIVISLILLSLGGQFALWNKLGEISGRLTH